MGGDTSVPKFVQWSGHATGPMAPVLGALQIGGKEFPVFNDMIAMELYQVDEDAMDRVNNQYAVRVVHNGKVVTGLIPACPSDKDLCPWTSYRAYVSALVPSPGECGRSDDPTWWPKLARST